MLVTLGCAPSSAATTSTVVPQRLAAGPSIGELTAEADEADALQVPPAESSDDSATLMIEPDAAPEGAPAAEPALDAEDAPAPQAQTDSPADDVSAEQSYDAVFSEEDVELWQEEESVLAGPLALFGAVVLQKVRDYDRWRAKFDDQLEARKQAGFVAQGIMRGVDDDQTVAVWLAVTDVAHAKAFFSGSWRRLGVRARVKLSRNLAAEFEPDRTGLSAAIVTVKVDELAEFRRVFDETAQARADAGLVGYSLGQDVDHEEIVYVYLQSEEPDALKAYLGSRDTKRVWKDGGVVAIKNVTLVREGELMRCR